MKFGLSLIEWKPSWRIIPSRFPPVDLFERVADANDLAAVNEIESLTNDRLREEAGDISLVPMEERVSGPGSSVIMAAFTHLNPHGSRFTDGTFGVFYTSSTLSTAVEETRYHRARFMRYTNEAAMEIDMRVYLIDLAGRLHDLRLLTESAPELYHPEDYAVSQQCARQLRAGGSRGIVYQSLRNRTGECAAVFRPKILSNCRQERHLCYVWNGRAIETVYQKQLLGG